MEHIKASEQRLLSLDEAKRRNIKEINLFEDYILSAVDKGLFEIYWDTSETNMSPNVVSYFETLGYKVTFEWITSEYGTEHKMGTLSWK